jgi:hypothetical protein
VIDEFAGGIAKAATVTLLAAWTTAACADVFTANLDNGSITLTCEGSAVVNTSCSLRMVSGGQVPVRFTTRPTRYAHLLKRGVEKVIENKQHPFRPSDEDVAILRGLALDQCHPAAESRDLSGDLLQLCVPPSSSSNVVLFMRGLCDGCDFEPLVLRKRPAQ